MDEVARALALRGLSAKPVDAYLTPIILRFVQSGQADANYLIELCSAHEGQFWSRVWEALLYDRMVGAGWSVRNPGAGPDFLIERNGLKVLVEAAAPSPDGLPEDWINHQIGRVYNVPHEQMLLRWTAKLSDKAKKHAVDVAKGSADPALPFVIAINSHRLNGVGPEEHGISQWPFPVEATFPVGPIGVTYNRETSTWGSVHQTLRFNIAKNNGQQIPTDNFLDPNYAHVSALIGTMSCYASPDTCAKFHGQYPYFIVYNPLATNKLLPGWLPGAIEYVARQVSYDEYELKRITDRDNEHA